MAWQPSDWIALAGVTVTPIVSLLIYRLTVSDRRREADEGKKQRDAAEVKQGLQRSGEVLGPVLAVLNDARPDIQLIYGPRDVEIRWWQAREPLVVFATSHPSGAVRREAAKLVTAMDNVMLSLDTFMKDTSNQELEEIAHEFHVEASQLAMGLMDEVQPEAGRDEASPPEDLTKE